MTGGGRRAGVLALLGCLVAVGVLVGIRPDPGTDFRRRYDDVAVGETGHLREFDVTVTRVRRTVEIPIDSEDAFISRQAVIVVDLEGVGRSGQAWFSFSSVQVETRGGALYDLRPEFTSAQPDTADPGFTSTGSLVFELPPDRFAGARLLIDPPGRGFDVYDAAVRVDLGLTAATPVVTLTTPLPAAQITVTR